MDEQIRLELRVLGRIP